MKPVAQDAPVRGAYWQRARNKAFRRFLAEHPELDHGTALTRFALRQDAREKLSDPAFVQTLSEAEKLKLKEAASIDPSRRVVPLPPMEERLWVYTQDSWEFHRSLLRVHGIVFEKGDYTKLLRAIRCGAGERLRKRPRICRITHPRSGIELIVQVRMPLGATRNHLDWCLERVLTEDTLPDEKPAKPAVKPEKKSKPAAPKAPVRMDHGGTLRLASSPARH